MILELKRIRLQTLARILSGRKLYLKFGNSSHTDLKTITLNSFENEIVPGIKANKAECWIAQKAVCAHEAGHIRFTAKSYMEKAAKHNRLMPHLLNIVEDSRIERCMANTYSGCAAWFRFLNDYIFINRPDWGTGPQALLNGLITYAVVGRVPSEIVNQPEVFNLIEKCSTHIDKGRQADHTEGAWQETLKIWEIIKDYIGSFTPPDPAPVPVGTTTPEKGPTGPVDPRREPKLPKKPRDEVITKPDDSLPKETEEDTVTKSTKLESSKEESEAQKKKQEDLKDTETSPDEPGKSEFLEQEPEDSEDTETPPDKESEESGDPKTSPENQEENPDEFPEEDFDPPNDDTLDNDDYPEDPELLDYPDEHPEESEDTSLEEDEDTFPESPDEPLDDPDEFGPLPEDLDNDIASSPEEAMSEKTPPKEPYNPEDEIEDGDYDGLLDEAEEELSELESSAARSEKMKSKSDMEMPAPVTEEAITEELSKGIHAGIVFQTQHISCVSKDKQKELYQQLYQRVKPYIGKTVTELKRILEYKATIKETNLPKGRLNTNGLWKIGVKDTKLFYRIQEPGSIPKIAIYLLVDCSGSMCTDNKIPRTKEAACLLYETCIALNIPVKITGFTGEVLNDRDVTHLNFVDFDEQDTMHNITQIRAISQNRDGYSIRVATKELESRTEEQKVLIVLSDGIPLMPYKGYTTFPAVKDTALAVREAQKKGIGVIGLYFGDKTFLNQAQLIYDDLVFVKEVETLPQQVARVLKKTISRLG